MSTKVRAPGRKRINGTCRHLSFLFAALIMTFCGTEPCSGQYRPQMAAGYRHTISLKSDGTVVPVGDGRIHERPESNN